MDRRMSEAWGASLRGSVAREEAASFDEGSPIVSALEMNRVYDTLSKRGDVPSPQSSGGKVASYVHAKLDFLGKLTRFMERYDPSIDAEAFLRGIGIKAWHLILIRILTLSLDLVVLGVITIYIALEFPEHSGWAPWEIACVSLLCIRIIWCSSLLYFRARTLWRSWRRFLLFIAFMLVADCCFIVLVGVNSANVASEDAIRIWTMFLAASQFVIILSEAKLINFVHFWRFRMAFNAFFPTLASMPFLLIAIAFMIWSVSNEEDFPGFCMDETQEQQSEFTRFKFFICITKGLVQVIFGELDLFTFAFNKAIVEPDTLNVMRAILVTVAVFFFAMFIINAASSMFRLPPIDPNDIRGKNFRDRNQLWLLLFASFPLIEVWDKTRSVRRYVSTRFSHIRSSFAARS